MYRDVSVAELDEMMKSKPDLKLIDVREANEYGTGHVPGAVNVPLSGLGNDFPEFGENDEIVVICQGGVRSVTACQRVAQKHTNLTNLVGGTGAWIKAGLPTE